MNSWRTCILAFLLIGSVLFRADSTALSALTTDEYVAELDRLLIATQQLNSSSPAVPDPLKQLPQSWRVHTNSQDFEIASEGLRRDVQRYEGERSAANATAIRTRIESLRTDVIGFEQPASDVSAQHDKLNAILADREFRNVHGPTWFDRLKRRMLEYLFRLLGRLFRSNAIPTIGKYFVYGLIGLAGLALLYVVYRSIFAEQGFEEVVPKDLPVSAKEWTIWLSEAQAAAARGDWRDAVHLGYWAGISFLERQGSWKPDRARTPREYLRLISAEAEERGTLTALTQIFELTWYARRPANEATFSQTLEQLEKLGCR